MNSTWDTAPVSHMTILNKLFIPLNPSNPSYLNADRENRVVKATR